MGKIQNFSLFIAHIFGMFLFLLTREISGKEYTQMHLFESYVCKKEEEPCTYISSFENTYFMIAARNKFGFQDFDIKFDYIDDVKKETGLDSYDGFIYIGRKIGSSLTISNIQEENDTMYVKLASVIDMCPNSVFINMDRKYDTLLSCPSGENCCYIDAGHLNGKTRVVTNGVKELTYMSRVTFDYTRNKTVTNSSGKFNIERLGYHTPIMFFGDSYTTLRISADSTSYSSFDTLIGTTLWKDAPITYDDSGFYIFLLILIPCLVASVIIIIIICCCCCYRRKKKKLMLQQKQVPKSSTSSSSLKKPVQQNQYQYQQYPPQTQQYQQYPQYPYQQQTLNTQPQQQQYTQEQYQQYLAYQQYYAQQYAQQQPQSNVQQPVSEVQVDDAIVDTPDNEENNEQNPQAVEL